jgi:hypothetical protein
MIHNRLRRSSIPDSLLPVPLLLFPSPHHPVACCLLPIAFSNHHINPLIITGRNHKNQINHSSDLPLTILLISFVLHWLLQGKWIENPSLKDAGGN